MDLEEAKRGLYANIHAKRKRGEAPAKPGDEDYPEKDAFKKAAKTAKKEGFSNWRGELFDEGVIPAAINLIGEAKNGGDNDPCWDTHKQVGMKKKRGKMVPNCVPKEGIEIEDVNGNKVAEIIDVISNEDIGEGIKQARKNIGASKCWDGYKAKGTRKKNGKEVPNCVKEDESEVTEAVRIPAKTGNILSVFLTWRGKLYMLKMFFPQVKMPTRSEIQDEIQKVYPDSIIRSFSVAEYTPGEQLLQVAEGAAWTKKSGKSESGGLNEKGRKSYERENPGSDLKAPSKKVGNPRRKSFCARMRGMKKKLTSKKTANDPDSRINKSLRAWNC